MVTENQVRRIAARLQVARVNAVTEAINLGCSKYGVNSFDVLHEFLANVLHESGEFSIKAENLRYTSAQRLVAIWPTRFTTRGEAGKRNAIEFLNDPVKLANAVYNGRMGNLPGTNDGFNFRGGGYAQITGKEAYQAYLTFVNKRDVTNYTLQQLTTLVQTTEQWAFDSAFWFFCIFKNLEQFAIDDNFREVVRRWNGGFIGIEERQKYYDICKRVLA
jgi:putative chitinase